MRLVAREAEERRGRGRAAAGVRPAADAAARLEGADAQAEARCLRLEAELVRARAALAAEEGRRTAAETDAASSRASADARCEEARQQTEEALRWRWAATRAVAAAVADKAEVEREAEGMEEAMVRWAVGTMAEATPALMAGAPTAVASAAEVSVQTEPWEVGGPQVAVAVAEAAVQTVPAEETAGASSGVEMTVGRRLHPAQERALERAEAAAAQIERVQADVEALAARHTARSEDASATASTASESARLLPARTGGKQAKKARLRRQAAEARVDVAEWKAMREAQLLQTRLPRLPRMEAAECAWRYGDVRAGEVRAEWSFLQAAKAAGISVEDDEM